MYSYGKDLFASRTVHGLILIAVGGLLSWLGFQFDDRDAALDNIAQIAGAIGEVVGLLIALAGRIRAVEPITKIGGKPLALLPVVLLCLLAGTAAAQVPTQPPPPRSCIENGCFGWARQPAAPQSLISVTIGDNEPPSGLYYERDFDRVMRMVADKVRSGRRVTIEFVKPIAMSASGRAALIVQPPKPRD